MKKFLFTLAALLMAGSLCAEEYMYIDDFEVSQELLSQTAARNRRMTIPVKAHFDCYVNAWQVDLAGVGLDENVLPEGISVYSASDGPGMTITYMNDMCEEVQAVLNIGKAQNNTRVLAAVGVVAGYWFEPGMDPDNDDPVSYGSIKWIGDYDCMFNFIFQFEQDFTGCDLRVITRPASGTDTRGEVCPKNQVNEHICHITVEGGEQPKQDLQGQIVVSDPTPEGTVTISYNGEEDVTITVNGEAYNGEALQLVVGSNTFDVVVTAEGYNDLTGSFIVNWDGPQVTDAPVITYETTETEVIITATGNGVVTMYVNNELVQNPYIVPRGEEDTSVLVTAFAQEDGKEMSAAATLEVPVPALGGEPVDPHMQGFWLVAINQFGGLEWYQLFIGDNGDYTTTVAFNYDLFGGFDPETEERPVVDYFFMINGTRWGVDGEVETVLGTAMSNPLAEADGCYTLPVGYNYNLGVAIGLDGDYYVYAAQATTTGIDEMINGKTVASQRFFNLAGQEMTEANGVTIVVTTYTDGTTSATKVMK